LDLLARWYTSVLLSTAVAVVVESAEPRAKKFEF